MFFRNVTLFRFPARFPGLFPSPVADELQALDVGLDECRLKPVGPLELASRGFISPYGREAEALTVTVGQCTWLTIGGEDKLLPPAVVNDLLGKKLDEIERTEGRKPGGRTRKRLKDELITELLPRAFVSPSRVDAYFDLGRGFIAVDSPARRVSENVVSEVRRAIGSFPALPINCEVAPRAVLTGWLAGEPLPEGLSLGDECELRDPIDHGGVVKVSNMELQGDEVAKHLETGKQCTRLALNWDDRISFVLGEDMVLRKFRLLDAAIDALDEIERDTVAAELDARFALMSGEFGRVFDLLARVFHFSTADEPPPRSDAAAPTSPRPAASGQLNAKRSSAMGKTQPGRLQGVETVTISVAGMPSVTLTAEQFAELPGEAELFGEAIAIVRDSGNAGISHLQRRLKIGYNRAGRVLEAMERAGIVTPPNADGVRTVVQRAGVPA